MVEKAATLPENVNSSKQADKVADLKKHMSGDSTQVATSILIGR